MLSRNGLLGLGLGLGLAVAGGSAGALAEDYRAPRTPSGAPDLGGLWDNGSYTKLQRPKSLADVGLVISPEAARAHEAKLAKYHGLPSSPEDAVGQNDSEFPDSGRGMARIRGQLRTSWIVDPPDGRIPYTAEAKRRLHIGEKTPPESFDNPEDRPQLERCLTSAGSSPPLLSMQDANVFELVQTPDHLAVVSEKNHDVRIIPLRGKADPGAPATWAGNAIGHWEGDTLVVETTGFRGELIDRAFLAHSAEAKVVERFTRTSPSEILYAFEVTDPKTYTKTWRAEMLFSATTGPLYEYACHEGNYSLPNIMAAARQGRQAPPTPSPCLPAAKTAALGASH